MKLELSCSLGASRPLAVPFVGPLDGLTAGLTYAADIKRRLLSSYTGPAATVRADRTGQPTYQIPYLANGAWDTAGLLSFAGSDSVYVTNLPIQYGSLPSLTQAVAALQPRIVNAGVLETDGMFFVNGSGQTLKMPFSGISDMLGASQGQIIFRQRAPVTADYFRPVATTVGGLLCYSPLGGFIFYDYGIAGRIVGNYPAGADDAVVDVSLEHYSVTGKINVAGTNVLTAAQADALTGGAGVFLFGSDKGSWLSSLSMWNTCDSTLAAARRAALA